MPKVAVTNKLDNVILFDGICNLCNGAINFVIDRDKNSHFKFAALQSEYGQQYLQNNELPLDNFESMLFLEDGEIYLKSTAALKIARNLNGLWPMLYGFIIIPKFIRDAVYKFFADNRYKFFGKRDQCRVPTPELRVKFLDW